MVASPVKEKIIYSILAALFIGFFAVPLVATFCHQCKIPSKPMASVLLFFFR